MLSNLETLELLRPLPEGVKPGADRGAMVTARLLGVDIPARAVQVSVLGSEGVWVPAAPAIYTPEGLVRLLRSPLDGGRVTYCLGPLDEVLPVARGEVTAVNTSAGTLTVRAIGSSWVLPFNASTYSVGQFVHVLRDPASFGRPYLVSGPEGNFTGSNPAAPGGGAGNPAQTESRQVTVGPQWTGSWTGTRWDSWNASRGDYGGRAALYQGQGYGSPVMQGLAVYGDQIANLGAVSIDRMLLTIKRAPAGSGTGGAGYAKTAIVQTSPHGGGAPGGGPGGSGPTAGELVAAGQTVTFDLPSGFFEPFRTGSAKGLALVGSDYLNLLGTTDAAGMVLTVQFTVLR